MNKLPVSEIVLADCTCCKNEEQVYRINDTPDGCQHKYCEKCLRLIVLSTKTIKRCIFPECEHIISPKIFGKFISEKICQVSSPPLLEINLPVSNGVFKTTLKTKGFEMPFKTLEIPNSFRTIGFHEDFNISENFLLVVDPTSAFSEINKIGLYPNACRIFLYLENNYFALKPTGRIIPFRCNIGIFGRCPVCCECLNLAVNKRNFCSSCKIEICLKCGLQNCQEHIMTLEELEKGVTYNQTPIINLAVTALSFRSRTPGCLVFLSMNYNIPYVVRPFQDLGLSPLDIKMMNQIPVLLTLRRQFPGKTFAMLTDAQKQQFSNNIQRIVAANNNKMQDMFTSLQFIAGIPHKFVRYFIERIRNHLLEAPHKSQNPMTQGVINPAVAAGGGAAQPQQQFTDGIASLLAAAEMIDEPEAEPPAKKTMVPIPVIDFTEIREMFSKVNKDKPAPVAGKVPPLMKPTEAAHHQIQIAMNLSNIPGMPKFTYPKIAQANQAQLAVMYREQITVANAYIDMVIKKIYEQPEH
jgi:hypothetical protein